MIIIPDIAVQDGTYTDYLIEYVNKKVVKHFNREVYGFVNMDHSTGEFYYEFRSSVSLDMQLGYVENQMLKEFTKYAAYVFDKQYQEPIYELQVG